MSWSRGHVPIQGRTNELFETGDVSLRPAKGSEEAQGRGGRGGQRWGGKAVPGPVSGRKESGASGHEQSKALQTLRLGVQPGPPKSSTDPGSSTRLGLPGARMSAPART